MIRVHAVTHRVQRFLRQTGSPQAVTLAILSVGVLGEEPPFFSVASHCVIQQQVHQAGP